MSTEFFSTLELASDWSNHDDVVRFVRWAGKPDTTATEAPTGRCCWEFGTMTNFLECVALTEMGGTWVGMGDGCDEAGFGTAEWFQAMVRQGRATFGRFGITVAAGSETDTRFSVE